MTYGQWEARKVHLEELFNYQMTSSALAQRDRAENDVEWETASWKDWWEIDAKRKADGWVLADYGQIGSFETMSGYWKRTKLALAPDYQI